MNIGPGNIEALLLDALEGRLSAAEAAEVWAALEAHPEWGVSWDFEDRELPRLQADDVLAMDWSGLKKEVVTDQQIRQALRQDRDRHTLDADVKQSLYRREERALWRYWAAAASVALLVWLAWPTGERSNVPSIAETIKTQPDSSAILPPTPAAPAKVLADDRPSTTIVYRPSQTPQERIIIEHCAGTPEQIQEEVIDKVLPLSDEEWIVAQGNDTTSLEAPLQLPFDLPPTQEMAVVESIITVHASAKTTSNSYTPLAWLKMKAAQLAARKEADGTLPTVRRDKQSFNLQWGSLSINAH
ncbi:MAG: hypothetical protein ACK478_09630 [Flavobacteriales bacterium]|jgi:hypothetical protein